MKRILKISLFTCVIFATLMSCALAEAEHGALILDGSQTPEHGALFLSQTPELGDTSCGVAVLASLSVLTLAGAIVAHKKVRSNAL